MNCSKLLLPLLCLTSVLVAQHPQRLTDDGLPKRDPVFLNADRLVYAVESSIHQVTLVELDLRSRRPRRLHPTAGTSQFSATYSRDGQRSAWIENNGNLHVKIVMRDAADEKLVEHNPGGGFAGIRELSLHPDGDRLLYAFPENGVNQQIFALRFGTDQRSALTADEGYDTCPRFSPDGRWIAFSSDRQGDFGIWIMTADGLQPFPVSDQPGLETRPCWSPDGQWLAFTRLHDGNYDLFAVRRDGSGLQRLTEHPERDDYACWLPNGRQLVFAGERRGAQDLYLLDLPAELHATAE